MLFIEVPKNSKVFKGIVLHCSASPDSKDYHDWEDIKKYQMSYRINYNTVSATEYYKRILLKKKGDVFEKPDLDVAYHFGIENYKGDYTFCIGRPLSMFGAHCYGHNDTIGICTVGNFDYKEPLDIQYQMAADLCSRLLQLYPNLTKADIKAHNFYNPERKKLGLPLKTCPGLKYDMNKVLERINA